MKSISFKCQEGGSNKEYHIQMVEQGSGFVINFQYGAIGQTLKPGTKTPTPVSEVEAEKIYQSMIKERLKKGYTQEGEAKGGGFSGPAITTKVTHGTFPQLLNTIDDEEVQKYINDDRYLAQPKMDGQRRMIDKYKDEVRGINKKGEIVQLPNSLHLSGPDSFLIDGEIIGEVLYAFDILNFKGKDIRGLSCEERLKVLNSVYLGDNVEVVLTAYTREEKQKMYDDLKANNAEGIVFKLKESKYVAGRPSSGGPQLKNKFQKEASFIVRDLTNGKRSIGLELIDRENNDERVYMGKCTIPPNKDIPPVGSVVEVRYLYAYRGGAIFQPCYKEQRVDVYPGECLMSQIIYKAGQEEED